MNIEITKYIKNIKKVCPELTDTELLQFSKGLTVSKLAKKEFCIKTGQFQQQGGFLIEGLIRAYHIDKTGNEQTIYFIPENEYTFHYTSFISQQACPLFFECLEPSIIVNFSLDHFKSAYQKNPKFEKYSRLILEEKLKIQQERLEGHLYLNAEQRYLSFLHQYPNLMNRIQISHLCSYLGVKRQTLTRIRKKLMTL